MTDLTPRPAVRWPVAVALALTAGLLLVPLPGPWRGGWRATLLDLGHVPLFAGLVFVLVRPGRPVWRPVVFAVAIAGLAELAQLGAGRSADVADVVRGSAGALAAGAVVQARRARGRPARAIGCLLVAVGLVGWPLIGAGPQLVDAYEGSRAFPVLAEFRTDRELVRWHVTQAGLTRIEDPDRPDARLGRLEFRPGPDPYPGAVLEPVATDFRGYRWLCCAFEVEGGPLEVVISVRDRGPRGGPSAHYQEGRAWGPGPHVIRLDLPAIAARARRGPLDLADVRAVQLFVAEPPEPRAVRIHRIWLED